MEEDFYSIFDTEDVSKLSDGSLIEFRKFCVVNDNLSLFIDRIHQTALNNFSFQLIESIVKLLDELGDITFDNYVYRRSKIQLSIFYQMLLKSMRFRETMHLHSIAYFAILVRVDYLRIDLLSIIKLACRHLFRAPGIDEPFIHFLGDLAMWWNQRSMLTEMRDLIIQIFHILITSEYLFVYRCFRIMDKETFCDVLTIMFNLIERYRIRFEPSNVLFCVDFLEALERDLSQMSMELGYRSSNNIMLTKIYTGFGMRMFFLASIISEAAKQRPDYDSILHIDQRAVRLICGLLRILLEAEEIRRREIEEQKATALNHLKKSQKIESENMVPAKLHAVDLVADSAVQHDDDIISDSNGCDNEDSAKQQTDANICKEKTSAAMLTPVFAPKSTSPTSTAIASQDKAGISGMPSAGALTHSSSNCSQPTGKRHVPTSTSPSTRSPAIAPANPNSTIRPNVNAIASDSGDKRSIAASPLHSFQLLQLVLLKRMMPLNVVASMREACIRAVASLCAESPANQNIAGVQILSMLLRYVIKHHNDNKAIIPKKATFSLRMICIDNPENQQRLLSAFELTGTVFDRTRLLANIGFRPDVEMDTDKIVRLIPNENVNKAFSSPNVASSSIVESVTSNYDEDEEMTFDDEDDELEEALDEDDYEEDFVEDAESDLEAYMSDHSDSTYNEKSKRKRQKFVEFTSSVSADSKRTKSQINVANEESNDLQLSNCPSSNSSSINTSLASSKPTNQVEVNGMEQIATMNYELDINGDTERVGGTTTPAKKTHDEAEMKT